MVAPVAVGADPDLEQRRLALDDRPIVVAVNVLIPGPDQTSEKPSASSTLPAQPVPSPWTKPCHSAATCASLMPGRIMPLHVLHRGGRDLVREPHPLDLLRGLDGAASREERRRVDRVRERVEPRLREGRRLADHAVGSLRPERELEADRAVLGCRRGGKVERAQRAAGAGRGVVAGRRGGRRTSSACARRPPRSPPGR